MVFGYLQILKELKANIKTILAIIANAALMCFLLRQNSVVWLLNLYYLLQIVESLVEAKLQALVKEILKKYGGWIMLGYVVFLVLQFSTVI